MSLWAGTFQAPLDQSFFNANLISNWVDWGHYNHLKKYGYVTMLFLEYNYSGNWP
jgi:hypothetical protein